MPTLYLQLTELDDRVGPAVADRTEDGKRLEAIQAASATADGYLRAAGYALPLATANDAALKKAVADLAVYDITQMEGLLPEPVKESAVYLNMKAAHVWFQAIVDGTVSIVVTDDDGATTVGSAPRVATSTSRGW
jgi:phage gp36-like protein